jgi:hypothetical protein
VEFFTIRFWKIKLALPIHAPATVRLSAANKKALLGSAAIARRQVCQDLDIGDGIGKRKPISAPDLQRPKHFQLFAIGLRKIELTLTDPDV